VSSTKDPKTKNAVSRRGFLGGMGIGTGAVGAGLLESEAIASPAVPTVGPGAVPITLNINGKPVNVTVEPSVTLLDALRNHLDYTGAKKVCDRGTCGACTVMLAGKSVYACSVLAIDARAGISKPSKVCPSIIRSRTRSSITTPNSAAIAPRAS